MKESGDDEQGALVADLAICGVWQPQCEGIFYIWVVDTDTLPYCSRLARIEESKFYPNLHVS